MVRDADRYVVRNSNDPNPGNVTEEKQSELEEFIYYAKLVVGSLGFKVFEPLINKSTVVEVLTDSDPSSVDEGPLVFCTYGGANASGRRTSEGFVVSNGSKINAQPTPSTPRNILRLRNEYQSFIDENWCLKKDLLFKSPSAAAGFVGGASLNGNEMWKSESGVRLSDLEAEELDI